MSQASVTIPTGKTHNEVRLALNAALAALASCSSGSTAPNPPTALWLDTSTTPSTWREWDGSAYVPFLAASLVRQRGTACTTTGTGSAYVATPSPALSANSASARFAVTFHAAGSGTPTLSVSGLTPLPVKAYNPAGTLVAYLPGSGQICDVVCNGSAWIVMNPLPQLATTAQAQALTDTTHLLTPALMASALNMSGSAPAYACRAWMRFNGSTNTVSGSGNVSSVTDNGTGDFSMNFSIAMPSANYAALPATKDPETDSGGPCTSIYSQTVSAVRVTVGQGNTNALYDSAIINVGVFH